MSAIYVPGESTRLQVKKPELLAPAGTLEKLKFAVSYGADAVYIGGQQYGLRANAGNFTYEEMREGVEFARRYGSKVYVAANIIAHNEDLAGLADYFRNLQDIGIDAVIVADPAIVEACKEAAPQLEIHLSTQASTTNWLSVKYWKEEGISRVVMAREVSLDEIKQIKEHVDVELEAFIHGAMCISYSGRCVLSNHFTARDSNRGGCSQSCRWNYDLFEERLGADGEEEHKIGQAIPLFEEQDNHYTMSSKDLCMIEHIPELVQVGIDSFKVEGRMKSIHYVSTVCKVYREAIDAYWSDPDNYVVKKEWVEELDKAAQRSATTGFFFRKPDSVDQLFGELDEPPVYEFAGLVLDYDEEKGMATVQQRNHFRPGDTVEFFGPGGLFAQKVERIWDEEGNELDAARHPMQRIRMKVEQPVQPDYLMRLEIRKR